MPVEIGDPAALCAEEALQNHATLAGFEGFIHSEVPPGDCVKCIDDAVQSILFLVHLREPTTAEDAGELAVLLGEHMGPRPTIGVVGTERAPVLAIAQIGGRFSRASALRFHPAAGNQLAQHLAKHGTPLVHGRRSAFGMDGPLRRVAADGLGELFGTFSKQIAEPAFAPRRHV